MLEIFSGINNLRIEGGETLETIADLNAQGRTVIFAPNHIAPQGRLAHIRTSSVFADDFPVLDKVLEDAGIDSKIVARGDANIEVGNSKINKIIYTITKKIFSALVRIVTGGIPVAINEKDPKYAARMNIPALREIISTLKTTNLTIYPYGNWFESGAQTFDEMADLEEGRDFVGMEHIESWRKSLKDGFVKIAKKSQAPIVPVYVENKNGEWLIAFGKPIVPGKEILNVGLAKQYLASMRELKAFSEQG